MNKHIDLLPIGCIKKLEVVTRKNPITQKDYFAVIIKDDSEDENCTLMKYFNKHHISWEYDHQSNQDLWDTYLIPLDQVSLVLSNPAFAQPE